ncbi:hypothetical protein M0R45_002232 [Rubus argutus]|uniref:Uncharacterized protein n=1 Tax=Rubus argutus TaxID=59490 RepID=A0AAW1VI17_RUBAR
MTGLQLMAEHDMGEHGAARRRLEEQRADLMHGDGHLRFWICEARAEGMISVSGQLDCCWDEVVIWVCSRFGERLNTGWFGFGNRGRARL